MLEIAPIHYSPSTGRVRFADNIKVEVDPIDVPGTDEAPPPRMPAIDFDAVGSATILNYFPMRAPIREKLLVIAGQGFEKDKKLARLIEWKKQKGLEVEKADVADIGKTPEAIRAFIKKDYETSSPISRWCM